MTASALQRRKHEATLARKTAFLDLNAAEARQRVGKEDKMEFWINRYRWAVIRERATFGRMGR